jgi:hypothetical protein
MNSPGGNTSAGVLSITPTIITSLASLSGSPRSNHCYEFVGSHPFKLDDEPPLLVQLIECWELRLPFDFSKCKDSIRRPAEVLICLCIYSAIRGKDGWAGRDEAEVSHGWHVVEVFFDPEGQHRARPKMGFFTEVLKLQVHP